MSTKSTRTPTPGERLTATALAEDEARATLSTLRERHQLHGDVSAQEFGDAAHAVELAELAARGAEAAAAEAQRQERLATLAAIRAEIETRAYPTRAAEAFTRAADAIADLIAEIGPTRAAMVSDWQRRLMALGVPPIHGPGCPSPDDGNLGWRDTSWGGIPGCVIWMTDSNEKRAAHASFDLPRLLDAIVTRASAKAGTPAHLFGTGHGNRDLAADPQAWFRKNN